MKKQPKITVITITYNLKKADREKTFRQSVESVHNQTYKNIEHLIIDGASTDGTLEIIKEYADKGYLTYHSEPDNGIYDAMNKGLAKATGDYILFLNSDDYFYSNKGLEKSIKTILKNNADFSYAECTYLTGFDRLYGILKTSPESFFVRMPFSHQTLLVKKDLMAKLNNFDTNFNSAGDYDFIVRLFLSGAKGVKTNCNFIAYRLGGLSDTNQEQSINECIKSFMKNYSPLEEHSEEEFRKMFLEMEMPKTLYEKILAKTHPDMNLKPVIKNSSDNIIVKKISRAKKANLIFKIEFKLKKLFAKIKQIF